MAGNELEYSGSEQPGAIQLGQAQQFSIVIVTASSLAKHNSSA
jgi:hypothetical protein